MKSQITVTLTIEHDGNLPVRNARELGNLTAGALIVTFDRKGVPTRLVEATRAYGVIESRVEEVTR